MIYSPKINYFIYPGLKQKKYFITAEMNLQSAAEVICEALGTTLEACKVSKQGHTQNPSYQRLALVLKLREIKTPKLIKGVRYIKEKFSVRDISKLLAVHHSSISYILKAAKNLLDTRFGDKNFIAIYKELTLNVYGNSE